MNELTNRQWIYRAVPEGRVDASHYSLEECPFDPVPAIHECIVEIKYYSVDPYMRIAQARRNTWEPPHPLNTLQGGGTVGIVIASGSDKIAVGDWVAGYLGWQKYGRCHADALTKLDPEAAPVSTALGVLGMPGRTAWFGLMEAGRPKPGETLVVSGAGGAVGSLVSQFGKRCGCKVIGIAGGPDKCRFLIDTLKLDGAIDYKAFKSTEALADELQRLTGGVDVYFDNVGGWITDAVIPLVKLRARVIICGQITQYEGKLDAPEMGPRFLHHLLFQRASITGILARDFTHRMPELLQIVSPWVKDGSLVFEETVVEGFERLPDALNMLFDGRNMGKLIVKA